MNEHSLLEIEANLVKMCNISYKNINFENSYGANL